MLGALGGVLTVLAALKAQSREVINSRPFKTIRPRQGPTVTPYWKCHVYRFFALMIQCFLTKDFLDIEKKLTSKFVLKSYKTQFTKQTRFIPRYRRIIMLVIISGQNQFG